MKSILSVFILLLSFSSFSKTYKIGVENIPYLPFYETKNENFRGFAKELLDAFAKDNKIKFIYVPLPIKRLYKSFLNTKNDIDFKFPDNNYWAQDIKKGKDIFYSKGIVSFTDGLFVLKQNIKLEEIKTLGVVRGFTPWDYLDLIKKKKIAVKENNSLTGLLKQGIANRLDSVYVNIDVAKYHLKSIDKKKKLKFNSSLPHTTSSYKLSTQKYKDVLDRLDKWIESNPKVYNELLSKWDLQKPSHK